MTAGTLTLAVTGDGQNLFNHPETQELDKASTGSQTIDAKISIQDCAR